MPTDLVLTVTEYMAAVFAAAMMIGFVAGLLLEIFSGLGRSCWRFLRFRWAQRHNGPKLTPDLDA